MERIRLKDVAEHAGVSLKTVSNVVNDHPHVREEMRERVNASIAALGYRPNITARRLATGRTQTIALAVSDISIPYFAEVAAEVHQACAQRGYSMVLLQTADTLAGERDVLNRQDTGLFDGLIFHPGRVSAEELAQRSQGHACVVLGESSPPSTVDHVYIDNFEAAKLVTNHLISMGRRNLVFLGYEATGITSTSMQRLMGFRAALAEAGITADPNREIAITMSRPQPSFEALSRALDSGVEIDGVVCRDDLPAIGALRALAVRGINVPSDVAVTGWDDLSVAQFTTPTLTSIKPDIAAIAATAVEQILARINGDNSPGKELTMPFSLVERESSAE